MIDSNNIIEIIVGEKIFKFNEDKLIASSDFFKKMLIYFKKTDDEIMQIYHDPIAFVLYVRIIENGPLSDEWIKKIQQYVHRLYDFFVDVHINEQYMKKLKDVIKMPIQCLNAKTIYSMYRLMKNQSLVLSLDDFKKKLLDVSTIDGYYSLSNDLIKMKGIDLTFDEYLDLFDLWKVNLEEFDNEKLLNVFDFDLSYQPYQSVFYDNRSLIKKDTVQTLYEFKQTMKEYSYGLIDEKFISKLGYLGWNDIVLAGGFVLNCLHKFDHVSSDIDFFVSGRMAFQTILDQLINQLEKMGYKNILYGYSKCIVTLFVVGYKRNIQIIHTDKSSNYDMIYNMHLDYIRCLFNGWSVYGTSE